MIYPQELKIDLVPGKGQIDNCANISLIKEQNCVTSPGHL
jgi:hypothetical protein